MGSNFMTTNELMTVENPCRVFFVNFEFLVSKKTLEFRNAKTFAEHLKII